jgi:hypothetical protein
MQRELPVAADGRSHTDWNQAVVDPCDQRWHEWLLYEVQRS